MKNKKVLVLVTAPIEPIKSHKKIFDHPEFDYVFVTHDKENKDAISFNKGMRWADNRNFLADKYKNSNYDYFMFLDYDVDFESKTELSVAEQILSDIDKYKPAVLNFYDPAKSDYIKKPNNDVIPYLVTNNQLKMFHSSLIDWFFPMETKFGGMWDTCHLFNMLEYPLKEHVLMSYNVQIHGLYNAPESQPKNGMQDMQNLHKWFIDKNANKHNFSFKTHIEFKNYCMYLNTNNKINMKINDTVDFKNLIDKKYFRDFD